MYLVQSQDSEGTLPHQILVREFFWMSFVAAFPLFPFGNWPNWDPRISLQGSFISYWMEDLDLPDAIMHQGNFSQAVRQYMWRELTEAVGYFLLSVNYFILMSIACAYIGTNVLNYSACNANEQEINRSCATFLVPRPCGGDSRC